MTKRNFVILAVFFIYLNSSYSQNSKWENFTDFKTVTSIAVDNNDNIYCASKGGLFVVEASSGKVSAKYTNLNGLINNDLTSLVVDNNRRLWIGSSDGSISILNLQNFTWKYILDIKNSSETNKIINFFYQSGNFMFVATGYGIQKISTSSLSFVDAPYYKLGSYTINTSVNSLTSLNNVLYAATASGIAYGNFATSNLNNPASWTNYNASPLNANVKTIENFDNKIFAGSLTGFRYFDGSSWLAYPNSSVSNQNTKFIKAAGNAVYFISDNNLFHAEYINLSNLYTITGLEPDDYTTLAFTNPASPVPVAGLSDNGVKIYSYSFSTYKYVFPNSPYTNNFNQIVFDENNNVWAAGGTGIAGFYKFDGAVWENYNTTTHPEIGSSNWFQKIAYGNGNIWALGFGGGPTIISGNTIKNFNTTNSILPGDPPPGNPAFCSSYGGAYDNNGVFWVSFFNTNSGRSLYAYLGSDQWIGFVNNTSVIGSFVTLGDIAVDSYNTKWIVSSGNKKGAYFFNENGTVTNPNDDVIGIYELGDFGGEVGSITDIIVDKNNEIWISTNNGIFIINNPLGAIQNPNQKPRPQKLGIISGNLKVPFTENCISITNDILNDKWIGTENNGVFHLSPDGSTLLEQIRTSNSPLLSNKVGSIAVSNQSGKAFFGTQNGLSSYLTDAIEPVAEFDEIIASPNPYLIPSGVNLKIDGLVEGSTVKIVTIDGEIVSEFESPGGRIASWNGRNQNNELTSSGIYIIIAYNEDGSQVGTGKVAIVRK